MTQMMFVKEEFIMQVKNSDAEFRTEAERERLDKQMNPGLQPMLGDKRSSHHKAVVTK